MIKLNNIRDRAISIAVCLEKHYFYAIFNAIKSIWQLDDN